MTARADALPHTGVPAHRRTAAAIQSVIAPLGPPEIAPTIPDRLYGAVAPAVFAAVYVAARAAGASAEELRHRRGFLPLPRPEAARADVPRLWLHGASAGEMAAAATLVSRLRARGLPCAALYTTTNRAGAELIARRLGPDDVCAFAPWDAARWVSRALERWQPRLVVLIETELWPALIRAAAAAAVPVVCASARFYPRDLPRYRAVGSLLAPTFRRLCVLAQNERERAAFLGLGAAAERCTVAGNLKHAAMPPPPGAAAAFRRAVGLAESEPMWVVGSVHADEAPPIVAACATLPAALRRVIAAPRHAAAARAIEVAATAHGLRVGRRSRSAPRDWQVLILDTIGELREAYASASLAVIGGTFGRHGGHDPVEPLLCGTPVLFGPHTAHVAADAAALRAALQTAAVATPGELAARVARWMEDPAMRAAAVAAQRGAIPGPDTIATAYTAAFAPWLMG